MKISKMAMALILAGGALGLLKAHALNPQPLPPGKERQDKTGAIPKDRKDMKQIQKNLKGNNETGKSFAKNAWPSAKPKGNKSITTGSKGVNGIAGGGPGKSTNTKDAKSPQTIQTNSRKMEEEGIYYYYKHDDSGHSLVTGKGGHDGSLKAGGKAVPQMNGPQDGKETQTTVKTAGKETLVNFTDGDPDKPIVTGQANNAAATTGGK